METINVLDKDQAMEQTRN